MEAWAGTKRLALEKIGETSFFVIKNKADRTRQGTGGVAGLLEGFCWHSSLLFLFCQQVWSEVTHWNGSRGLSYYTSNKEVTLIKRSCLNLFPRSYTTFSFQVNLLLSTWLLMIRGLSTTQMFDSCMSLLTAWGLGIGYGGQKIYWTVTSVTFSVFFWVTST